MPVKPMDCPVCGSTMQKRVVGAGVEIDYCDWHGVWLDVGEMDRLLPAQGHQFQGQATGIGRVVVKGLGGAAVVGVGFHLGGRLVGGILDAVFGRRFS
jgi:hypothetical protein